MSPRITSAVTLLATVLLSGTAYWLGRQHLPDPPTAPASTTAVSAPSAASAVTASDSVDEVTFAALRDDVSTAIARGFWSLNLTWENRFAALSAAQLRELTDLVVGSEPSDARGQLRRALYELWARVDPPGALAHASGIDFVLTRNEAFKSVFKGWAFADVTDLEAWVQAEPSGNRRNLGISALVAQVDDLPPQRLFGYLVESGLLERGGMDTSTLFSAWVRQHPQDAVERITADLEGGISQRTLFSLATMWAGSAPEAAFNWASQLPPAERDNMMAAVLNRWARRDPRAAAERAMSLPNQTAGRNPLPTIMKTWAEVDSAAALAWLSAQPEGSVRTYSLSTLIGTLFKEDPEAAMDYLEANSVDFLSLPESTARHYGELARVDPARAFAIATRLPAGRSQNEALNSVLIAIGKSDPARALALANDPAAAGIRERAVAQIIGQMASDDPEAAIAAVQSLPSASERDAALLKIVVNLAWTDSELAKVFAQALGPGNAQRNAYTNLANAMRRQDPAAAARWVENLPEENLRRQVGASMIEGWFSDDSRAALAWVQSQPDPVLQADLYRSISGSWSTADPAGFAAALLADPSSPVAKGLLEGQGSRSLGQTSPEIALQTIAQLPDGETRNLLIRNTVASLAQLAPERAQTLIASLPPGAVRESAIQNFIGNASQVLTPSALAGWLQGMGPGLATPKNYSSLSSTMLMRDPAGALEWAGNLPAGELRDGAVSGLTTVIDRNSRYLEVAPLLLTIGDATRRAQAINNLVNSWRVNDPTAARAWIESSNLDAATKQRLLAQAPSGP